MRGRVPEDVIKQILQNLPVKSLLRFMSVCPSWRSLIKSPSFISSHLTKTNCQEQQLLLVGCWVDNDCWGYSQWQCSLLVDDEEFKEYRKLINLPFMTIPRQRPFETTPRRGPSEIVGCCNGLVCLKKNDEDSYRLWNPTLGKLFTVPKSKLVDKFDAIVDSNGCDGANTSTMEGFGFDSSTNDYKLLRTVLVHGYTTDGDGYIPCWPDGWIDIYSYNAGSWKDITPPDNLRMPFQYFEALQPFFGNGFFYFLAWEETSGRMMVWQFDMTIDQVFREIILPEDVRSLQFLKAYSDSYIAFVEYSAFERGIRIWLMEENGGAEPWSWTNVFITRKEVKKLKGFPLLLRKNGELLLEKRCGGVVSYNRHRRKSHFLCKEGYGASVNYYVESLALLDIENEITDAEFESAFVRADSDTEYQVNDGDSPTDTDVVPFIILDRKRCQFLDM